MHTKATQFAYRKPTPVKGWGCHFDSLTELRFAISIMEDHAFLRSPVSMYFHPVTGQLAHFPRGCFLRYTPDFLIRNYETKQATLVEIKPRSFEQESSLEMHQHIANHYIRTLKFDWQYKIIFDDEILLTEQQLQQYQDCLKLPTQQRCQWFEEYYQRITGATTWSACKTNTELDFLMRGW